MKRNIFDTLELIEPPRSITFAVVARIQKEKQRIARIKLAFLGFSSVSCFVLIFPAVSSVLTGFTNSGFYEYLTLIFSDGATILPYWQEFGLTLAESLPAFEIALLLAVTYALLESVKLAIKNAPVAFYQFR